MAYKHYFFTYSRKGFPCLHGPYTSEAEAAVDGRDWQQRNEDDPRWNSIKLTDAEAKNWFWAVSDSAQEWLSHNPMRDN